jgi:hypothetical protein
MRLVQTKNKLIIKMEQINQTSLVLNKLQQNGTWIQCSQHIPTRVASLKRSIFKIKIKNI